MQKAKKLNSILIHCNEIHSAVNSLLNQARSLSYDKDRENQLNITKLICGSILLLTIFILAAIAFIEKGA